MPAPFDRSGTTTGPDGVRRYTGLDENLPHLLRAAVDAQPDREAVVELGGPRLTYRELWDRSARVAGGLRAAGVVPGDRVANRLSNGVDWVLGFWGTLLAGGVAAAPGVPGAGVAGAAGSGRAWNTTATIFARTVAPGVAEASGRAPGTVCPGRTTANSLSVTSRSSCES